MKTQTASLPSHSPAVQIGTTPSPDELALNRAVKEEATGRIADEEGTGAERSNDDIVNDLKARQITVERERVGPNGESEIYRAIWNNGNQPLEQHTLMAKSFREALLEAESINVAEQPQEARTKAPAFSGFRSGTGDLTQQRERALERTKEGSALARQSEEHLKDPQRNRGTFDQAQRPVPTGNPSTSDRTPPSDSPAPAPLVTHEPRQPNVPAQVPAPAV